MSIFISILDKLLNVPADSMPLVTQWQLQFRGWSSVGWVLLFASILGVLTFISYHRAGRHVSAGKKYSLAAVRTLFLLLLLSLLLRPILRFTLEGSVRRAMLVLVDSSASMATPEKRTEDPDLKRAAIVKNLIDPTKGLNQNLDKSQAGGLQTISRIDLVKAALTNNRLNLVNRLAKEYDIRPFMFGVTTSEISTVPKGGEVEHHEAAGKVDLSFVNKLTADAPMTPLGDAIKELLGRSRGQPLAGIFVITDGQNNSGSSPQAAAELARQSNVPLYIYGVGLASPKDIAVASIFSQDICFVDDQVPVVVRTRSTNLAGRTSKVVLKLGEQVVDTKEVAFTDDGEQVTAMQFTPKVPGEYDLSANVDALPEEANRTNNSDSKRIKVINDKIKVLLIEQYPRWEFKYLQALLARDRRVALKTYLAEADPELSSLPNSPYLKQIPPDLNQMAKDCDLMIIGDIDPKAFSANQLTAISNFVNRLGGGMIMIAGHRYSPGAWKGTPLEKLLPVELVSGRQPADSSDHAIHLEITPLGYESPMLRLSDKEDESKAIWNHLPPIYWDATVSRAKPGASVLVVDPDPNKVSRSGKMPVIAMQQYGLGQVLYVGTDNTWRWRKNAADRYHATLWGQMVERLSLPHLLGESKLTQLSTDKKRYATGDKVTIYARLYQAGTYDPVMEKSVAGAYESVDHHQHAAIALRPMPEEAGLYRGEFIAPEAGTYHFSIDRDSKEKLEIDVESPRLEMGETALNESLLKQIAATTNGGYFREEDLYKMPDSTRLKTERVKSKLEVDIWSSPAYFILLLTLVTIEWIGRKIVQLR